MSQIPKTYTSPIRDNWRLRLINGFFRTVRIIDRNYGRLIRYTVFALLVCLLGVSVVMLPAFSPQANFTTDKMSNLGSALAGVTAPVIGIISIVLLYITLDNQTKFNSEQSKNYEFDNVLRLIDELDKEINNFSFKNYHWIECNDAFDRVILCIKNEKHHPEFNLWYLSKDLNMIIDLAITLKHRAFMVGFNDSTKYAAMKLDAVVHDKLLPFLERVVFEMTSEGTFTFEKHPIIQCIKLYRDSPAQTWRPGTVDPYTKSFQ